MEYYRLLNLIREPFANTPNPDLFFPSRQHRACLQQLEMAVRLRRGLNVVIGDVGSGKTMLSRLLIRALSGDELLDTHLMLDPEFSDPLEFLEATAELFRIRISGEVGAGSRRVKEGIKRYLFQRGVKEKGTVVLIIDEGQKLSKENVEVLRELLNYETNDYKLLQIVIFAQKEFDSTVQNVANFRDRINLRLHLGPLSFREMGAMIRFRLERAAQHPTGWRPDFSWPALYAIYRATGGYPRGTIHLCHQCVLLMIIQNRASVNRTMVKACVRRSAAPTAAMPGFSRPVLAGGLVLLLTGVIFWTASTTVALLLSEPAGKTMSSGRKGATASEIIRKRIPVNDEPVELDQRLTPPAVLGTVAIHSGETLGELLKWVYGSSNPEYLEQVIRINTGITDPNRLVAGQRVRFPAIPVPGARKENAVASWRELRRVSRLEEAVWYLRRRDRLEGNILKLLPFWNDRNGLSFSIGYLSGSGEEAGGDAVPGVLPEDPSGQIIAAWPPDTVFFAAID